MPIAGTGIVPGAGNVANELTAVTRRAFLPYVTVQIYNTSPFLATCLANSQTATGGISSVTAPVQGNPMTTTSTIDYSGSFAQPAVQTGISNAEFDLAGQVTPIPFLGMEGILQMNHAVIPLIEARMNDATNNMAQFMSTALLSNTTVTTSNWVGLQFAVDDGTTTALYAGIDRTAIGNSWWQSKVYSATTVFGAGAGGFGALPTRTNVMQAIIGCQAGQGAAGNRQGGGEMPTMGLMGPGTWAALAGSFLSVEQYFHRPGDAGFEDDAGGIKSGFRAIMVAGVPIFLEVGMPEGQLFLLNTNYLNLYLHEAASFSFSGFETLLSNYTLGYIGVVLTLGQLVLTKPSTCLRVGTVGTNSTLFQSIAI